MFGFDRFNLISLILDHSNDIISASVADGEKRIALSMRSLNFVFLHHTLLYSSRPSRPNIYKYFHVPELFTLSLHCVRLDSF